MVNNSVKWSALLLIFITLSSFHSCNSLNISSKLKPSILSKSEATDSNPSTFLQTQLKVHTGYDVPSSPIAYYKDVVSPFTLIGLEAYFGTNCKKGRVVEGGDSISKPDYKMLYYTCDKCTLKKDYPSGPLGLLFTKSSKPERILYLDTQGLKAYRCN